MSQSPQQEKRVADTSRQAGNRRIGLALAAFVFLVFATYIVRTWLGNR